MDFSDLEGREELPPRGELPSYGARENDPRFQGIAASRGFAQIKETRIAKLHYTHEAMVDLILANPGISNGGLAEAFGYTEAWISRVINSDAFQAYLASRKSELIDPVLAQSLEDRLKGLVGQSIDVLCEKLEKSRNPEIALQALELGSKALGFGARDRGPVVNNSFVVALPTPAPSSQAWADHYSPQPRIIDVKPAPLGTMATFDPLAQPSPMKPAED